MKTEIAKAINDADLALERLINAIAKTEEENERLAAKITELETELVSLRRL